MPRIITCKCYLNFCCFFFVGIQRSDFLFLSGFACRPPKVSKISPSKPFFPKGSLVTDWPDGQLTLKSKLLLTDLSFVLFYAPWCAESQHARVSYEYVARLFAREAEFSAINCWQPSGECRAHYTKVKSACRKTVNEKTVKLISSHRS